MTIPERSSIRFSPAEHGMRTHITPTQYSKIAMTGISLESAVKHYLDWVEGRGRAAQRRRHQGVPSPLDRRLLLENGGGTIFGERGAEVAVRTEGNTIILRFMHCDEQFSDVFWSSIVRLNLIERGEEKESVLEVEHGTGRSFPPFRRLKPAAGTPEVLNRLLKVPGVRSVSPGHALTGVHLRSGQVRDFVNYILLDDKRVLPVLLISYTKQSNTPLVDVDRIRQLLSSQVTVVEIDSDATWELSQEFNPDYSCSSQQEKQLAGGSP